MAQILKPSQRQPVKCAKCNTSGTIRGSLGDVVCPDCLMVGYTNPDGTALDDNDAVRLLKKAEIYYKAKADKAEKKLQTQEKQFKELKDKMDRIRSLAAHDPGVYKSDGQGRVYHGD
ncbi:hypothetical protein [Endozoicomonas lisbonensis]|uniref:Transcription factor zinc-finger domain-containing protein n=1 Tax=Endozoicomonas lisbonensis TaxID=3120522 RepID=A0ABV2SP54_9GAMM